MVVYQKCANRVIDHDILFAGTGELIEEIGKSVVYTGEERCMAGGDIIVMQHSQEPRFLNYLFNCAYVQAQKSHDKYKLKIVHISDTSIGNMKVYMPDLGEQTIIADYLDSKCAAIDEAIERHKKIIEKLETFRHYMISHVVMHGLTNVEEKKFAPFDTCPKYWGVSRLKFVADVVRGGSPRPIDDYITDGEGYDWVKIGDATGNGKYITATKQKITEAGLSKTRLVRPGTLLLTNSMSFGHPYVLNIDGCIHDGWLAFSNYKGIDQDYLYYFLMSESAMIQFVRTVEGSVVNNLNIEKVKNSRLNRTFLGKDRVFIVDFVNDPDKVVKAFQHYDKGAKMEKAQDLNFIYDLKRALDDAGKLIMWCIAFSTLMKSRRYVLRRIQGKYHVTEFWADRDVSFTLERGEMLGIIGSNGAGKSTLLKAISGIMVPTEGTIYRKGIIAALLKLASGFDPELTARENAYLRGAMLGYTRKFMNETYNQIIEFAELKDVEDRPFKQLSSGMKSRLAFSIACLVKPDVLILDEVLSMGDGSFRKKVRSKCGRLSMAAPLLFWCPIRWNRSRNCAVKFCGCTRAGR